MSYVFFSYARLDRDLAREHIDGMRSKGIIVWQDISDIDPGEEWPEALASAITDSECAGVVVQWSEAAKKSKWVRKEIEIAQTAGKTIFPLLLDDTPLRDPLKTINAVKADHFDILLSTLAEKTPSAYRQLIEFDLGVAFKDQPGARTFSVDGTRFTAVPFLESSYSIAAVIGKAGTWLDDPKRIMLCAQFTGDADDIFLSEAIRFFQKEYPKDPVMAVHVKAKRTRGNEYKLRDTNSAEWYDSADTCLKALRYVQSKINKMLDIHIFGMTPVALGVLLGARMQKNTVMYLYNYNEVGRRIEYTRVAKTIT